MKHLRKLLLKGAVFGFIIAVAGGALFSSIYEDGLYMREATERGRRAIDRVLPVEPLDQRAKRSLQYRLDRANLTFGAPLFIRIFKQEAELEVWVKDRASYKLLHTYPICRFSGFLGPKLKEGDKQAPEGFYAVTAKQLLPTSRHYRAFNLAFPNEYDRAHGRTGSFLMVHGGCTSIGCYAMTDFGIAEIYQLVEKALVSGQKSVPVHAFPFRMTPENMDKYPTHRWSPFWQQLKVGYDLFQDDRIPPVPKVCNKRYVFGGNGSGCKAIAGWG